MSFGTFIHAEVCELYLLNEEVTHHLSSSLFYTISISFLFIHIIKISMTFYNPPTHQNFWTTIIVPAYNNQSLL